MAKKKLIKVAILTNYQREYVKYDFYFPSEQLMKKIFAEKGLDLHYVSPHYYHPKKKTFSEHVEIGKKDMKIIKKEYKPDILWVRTGHALYHMSEMFDEADFVVTPTMRLKKIESCKYQVYRFLEKYQPKTALLTSFYFYPWLQKEFGNRLVVKPLSGSGGYGIQFYDKNELLSMEVFEDYSGTEALHLVQEYKNFSKGAPGLVEGNHDLRVCFLGDKPSFTMIREPKKGSLKSNIADGGSQFSIPVEEIPEEVMGMANDIHKDLKVHDADVYSLDFAYCGDDKKWYLIEINSAPGIWFPDKDKHYQFQFFNDLAEHFEYLVDTYKG